MMKLDITQTRRIHCDRARYVQRVPGGRDILRAGSSLAGVQGLGTGEGLREYKILLGHEDTLSNVHEVEVCASTAYF